MFLDEKLLQIEKEQIKQKKQEQYLKEIKEDILEQEQKQKSVEDWLHELKHKTVIIDDKEYLCEKQMLLDGHAAACILTDDVERIIEENNIATVFYRTLEIGTNITFLNQPAVVKDETEFQEKLSSQYLKDKIAYCPLETGCFKPAEKRICFAEGIVTSAAGGVFINNFFCSGKEWMISGNYTCILLKRYTYEHLFRAMIRFMFEEDK